MSVVVSGQRIHGNYDGIICFGAEDWWYHNRGHNDIRFMRELAKEMPVLFINSLGLRIPKLKRDTNTLGRIKRKLKSIARGRVHVENDFHVISPTLIPGKFGQWLTGFLLIYQVKRAAKKIGIKHPLLWVVTLPGANFIDQIRHVGLVFQRSDRLELYRGADESVLTQYVQRLLSRADLVVYCNRQLMDAERDATRHSVFVDHGVNFEEFATKGRQRKGPTREHFSTEPDDLKKIPSPRIGFIGGLEPYTFDPALFESVARGLCDMQFVLVGRNGLCSDWTHLNNVHMLGMKPLDQVADYMAACDVLIMPWNDSPWIRACNPIKLKEYLAIGRPIVSTHFSELDHYDGLVAVANNDETFIEEIRAAICDESDEELRRNRVRDETWSKKAWSVVAYLREQGMEYLTHRLTG